MLVAFTYIFSFNPHLINLERSQLKLDLRDVASRCADQEHSLHRLWGGGLSALRCLLFRNQSFASTESFIHFHLLTQQVFTKFFLRVSFQGPNSQKSPF